MNTSNSPFLIALMQELMGSMNNWYGSENWDPERFGPYPSSFKSSLVSKFNELFGGTIAIVPVEMSRRQIQHVSRIRDSLDELTALYELLADKSSKQTLVEVLAYRLMGHNKVRLSHNTPSYWSQRKAVRSLIKGSDSIKVRIPDLTLNHLTLEKLGYPIELYFAASGVMAVFILKQYEYGKRNPKIRAEEGDYVIDGGGCWGDTALYFAHQVGEQGKVFAFEFTPENLKILNRNMDLNGQLSERIEVIRKALWDKSAEVINYSADGPGTCLTQSRKKDIDQDSLQVTTISIDDFIRERKLPRMDFIKMDIEGSEINALRGAEQTILRFKPKLAISIYHRDSDFIEIPKYLKKLDVGYEFFLDHFTVYGEETVLFAAPKAD
jgi:FkbM family methyltransferase